MNTINIQLITDKSKQALVLSYKNIVVLINKYKSWNVNIKYTFAAHSIEDLDNIIMKNDLDIEFEDAIFQYGFYYLDSVSEPTTHIQTFINVKNNIKALLVAVSGDAMVYSLNKNICELKYLKSKYMNFCFCFDDYSVNKWLNTYCTDRDIYNYVLEEIFNFEQKYSNIVA